MEIQSGMSRGFLELLVDELDLDPANVYVSEAPLGLHDLWSLYELDRPDLKGEGWSPMTPPRLLVGDHDGDVFAAIREGDILLHHPYDSFADSVEAFVAQAADDPRRRRASSITLYRTSGDSPVVKSLIRAAERGKQVAALVELKARFDEAANIEWAKALEDAGVHVVYGIVGLKTHSKTALVVRNEGPDTARYATWRPATTTTRPRASTRTSACSPATRGSPTTSASSSTSSPASRATSSTARSSSARSTPASESSSSSTRQRDLGAAGRIDIKVNGLTDPAVIDALYEASGAGVAIRLLVRTLCCLRPGVAGLSENISVHSVVGEFLEHSRIYSFGRPGEADFSIYLGSADLMERNLDRRVEVLVPITSADARAELLDAFETTWADDLFTWVLGTDRRWRRLQPVNGLSAQAEFKRRALARARSLASRS